MDINMEELKEEYQQMRKSNQFSIEWFYKFYVTSWNELQEEKQYKFMLDFETFFQTFQVYLQHTAEQVLNNLDSIFRVNSLLDQELKSIRLR